MIAAIYSRKSLFTGKGDSIENQIKICKEYGDRLGATEYIIYQDEGFSGKNTDRPSFKRMMADAKSKKFDIVICYKLDRISRNTSDFFKLTEELQNLGINFISTNEHFDTTTPIGKVSMGILAILAQFERETIAERVRDNMLQLAKTGRWLGGQEPFGYSAERITYIDEELNERSLMKLSPIEEELQVVKLIYSKYLELHSINQVVKYLNLAGIKGKNGGEWSTIQAKRLLSNPLYVKSSPDVEDYLRELGINVFGTPNGNGYLTYNKTKNMTQDRDITEWIAAIGKHKGVIECKDWLKVQDIMDTNKDKKLPRLGTGEYNSVLVGILRCKKCGSTMKIKQGRKSKENDGRYDYYACSNKDSSYGTKCDNKNVRVDKLDKMVVDDMMAYSKEFLIDELAAAINNIVENNASASKIENIKEDIDEKEKAISNLVKQLSLNSNEQVAKYIFSEMEKLNNEIKELKEELEKEEKQNSAINEQVDNTQIVVEALRKFNHEYDAIKDIKHRRMLLRTILDHITWNGDNYTYNIKLLVGDKKK